MESVELQSLPSELVQRIRLDLQAHFQLSELPSAVAAWQIVNPYSLVLCIAWTASEWSERVFVKLPLGPASAADVVKYGQYEHSTVRKEFEVLQELGAIKVDNLNGRVAATVVPLAYYIDLFALVTIDAGGTTLRRSYTRYARRWSLPHDRRTLLERVDLCGRWLRLFHEFTVVGFDSFQLGELQSYCRTRLERLVRRYPLALSQDEADQLMRAAARLASRIPTQSLRVSGRHNDFASHNIIARPDGGIRVLDLTMYDRGTNAFDVCNFWFELEMLKCDPSYSGSFLSDAQCVFLQSYGGFDADAPDFVLARLRYSINRLLNVLTDGGWIAKVSLHRHTNVRAINSWLRDFSAGALE